MWGSQDPSILSLLYGACHPEGEVESGGGAGGARVLHSELAAICTSRGG